MASFLEDTHPINWSEGIENLGDESLFQNMVSKYEQMSLDKCLNDLYEGVSTKDYYKTQQAAHSLKGSSRFYQYSWKLYLRKSLLKCMQGFNVPFKDV